MNNKIGQQLKLKGGRENMYVECLNKFDEHKLEWYKEAIELSGEEGKDLILALRDGQWGVYTTDFGCDRSIFWDIYGVVESVQKGEKSKSDRYCVRIVDSDGVSNEKYIWTSSFHLAVNLSEKSSSPFIYDWLDKEIIPECPKKPSPYDKIYKHAKKIVEEVERWKEEGCLQYLIDMIE